jgi:transposase
MKKKTKQQSEQTQDVRISPSLDTAIAAWIAARHSFQSEPLKHNKNAYMEATDELGQAISQWQDEQPELAEQFALFFASHNGTLDAIAESPLSRSHDRR